jgi:imidazolonepropionase-like amidohydrolase
MTRFETCAVGPFRGWSALAGVLVLLGTAACGGGPEPGADAGSTAIVIEGARLIDGTGGPVVEDSILVIEGDRIGVVGPRAAVTIPAGATTIDASGMTIIPGLINTHGHVGLVSGVVESRDNYTAENIRAHLLQYARYGVTTTTSLGLDFGPMFDLRGPAGPDEAPRATVLTAGRGFTSVDGYPAFRPHLDGIPYEVATVDEVRAHVQELGDQRVDIVKMWVDDHFGTAGVERIAPELRTAIIEEAHARGLRAVAHVFYLEDAKQLVAAGVDGLVHNVRDQPVDDELLRMLRERDVFVAPTLTREESTSLYAEPPAFLDDPFFTRHADPAVIASIRDPAYGAGVRADPEYPFNQAQFEMAKTNVQRLYEGGARLAFGTDSGPPRRFPGYFEHRELAMLVELGIPPAEVLRMATLRSAEALGISEDYGSLESGKRADFVLLGGDPLADILNTRQIEQVWIGGRRVE